MSQAWEVSRARQEPGAKFACVGRGTRLDVALQPRKRPGDGWSVLVGS
jgi:hypothetical protein